MSKWAYANSTHPRLRQRVDGILIVALPPQDPDLDTILKLGMPTAMIGGITPEVDCVAIDDVAAARKATEYLVLLGHSRIALMAGLSAAPRFTADSQREQGFHFVMTHHSLVEDPMLLAFGHFAMATFGKSCANPLGIFMAI